MKFSSRFTIVMKTSSLQLPSLEGTLSIKSMLQSAPKHVIFILKIQKFSGEGHSPLPRPLASRRGHPLPHPSTRRLRRLDLRAFGADMDVGWIHPWVRLDWVGLDWVGSKIFPFWWFGLGWVFTQMVIFCKPHDIYTHLAQLIQRRLLNLFT